MITARTFASLTGPWRRFPQTLAFYAATWAIGAIVLTLLHVWFPPPRASAPPAPPVAAPAPTPAQTRETPIDEISYTLELMAWHQALTVNSLDGYRNYILEFPNSQRASDAMKLIGELQSYDRQLQSAEMELADSDSSVEIITQLLENKDANPQSLENFVAKIGLKYKYPFGYGLFYSDGTKILSYEVAIKNAIRFDPTVSKVTFENTPDGSGIKVCLDLLPMRVNGDIIKNISNVCFGGRAPILHAVRWYDVSIDIEYLAASPRGAAWVIGMRP